MARNHAIWVGPLIVLVGAVSYFTYFAAYPALRDVPWVNLPLVALGLALSALGAWRAFARPERYRGRWLGSAGLVVSAAVAGLFALYLFSFSYGVPAPSALSVRLERGPDFELLDQYGNTVRLSDLRGRKVVLVFYRGHW